MELTSDQARALSTLQNFEKNGDFSEGIFCGPPSCGKTQVIAALIESTKVINTELEKTIDIFVTHYSSIYETSKIFKKLSISDDVFVINGPCNFKYLETKLKTVRRIVVLCMDTHFRRVCDIVSESIVTRIVFDNAECLNISGFQSPNTRGIWFVTSHIRIMAKRAKSIKSKFWKLIAFTLNSHDTVEIGYDRVIPDLHSQGLNRVILFSEPDIRVMNSAAKKLFDEGRDALAVQCVQGQDIRKEDASIILREQTFEKLQDECPICYEKVDNLPRVITPCCENNMCTRCFASWVDVSNACPICRTRFDTSTCYKVHSFPIVVLKGIVEETSRTIRLLIQDPSSKILVVATHRFFGSIIELMWRVGIDFIEISGNRYSLKKRTDAFTIEKNQLAVVEQRTIGFAPIRINRLTHVIFIGGTSSNTVHHWTTRALTPKTIQDLPEAIFIQSIYDHAFNL
jgi:hypothetical protein